HGNERDYLSGDFVDHYLRRIFLAQCARNASGGGNADERNRNGSADGVDRKRSGIGKTSEAAPEKRGGDRGPCARAGTSEPGSEERADDPCPRGRFGGGPLSGCCYGHRPLSCDIALPAYVPRVRYLRDR